MNGRIGVARRVHILKEFIDKGDWTWAWGTSLCGWSGSCEKTEAEASCYTCKRINAGMKKPAVTTELKQ